MRYSRVYEIVCLYTCMDVCVCVCVYVRKNVPKPFRDAAESQRLAREEKHRLHHNDDKSSNCS
jgi:hypothetical protein